MSHPNAALTPRHRLKVARLVVDDGSQISEVAARFEVSWPTVKRWVDRRPGHCGDHTSRACRVAVEAIGMIGGGRRCVPVRLRQGRCG